MKTQQQSHPALAKKLGVQEIYLKREDLHKYGSHKGRSMPLMIKRYVKDGVRNFVISSSGNAALAAVRSADQHNKNNPSKQITLKVYIGKNIPVHKQEMLQKETQDSSIEILQVERPKQEAFQLAKDTDIIYLRQSTDDLALEGYTDLAKELSKIPDIQAVFIPTSSGTTAQAVARYFSEQECAIQIHIVQTPSCHPIADEFDTVDSPETSIASAIVDKVAHRKQHVVDLVKESKGSGWIVSNDAIEKAIKAVYTTTNLDISPNSALSVAGLTKALEQGFECSGVVVCLITGA